MAMREESLKSSLRGSALELTARFSAFCNEGVCSSSFYITLNKKEEDCGLRSTNVLIIH